MAVLLSPACIGLMTLQAWSKATGLGSLLTAHMDAASGCTGLGDPMSCMAHISLDPRGVQWVGCGHTSAVPSAAPDPPALHLHAHVAEAHVEDVLEELCCWVSVGQSSSMARQ